MIRSKTKYDNSHRQWLTYQLLAGLRHIHSANVFHRDLKVRPRLPPPAAAAPHSALRVRASYVPAILRPERCTDMRVGCAAGQRAAQRRL